MSKWLVPASSLSVDNGILNEARHTHRTGVYYARFIIMEISSLDLMQINKPHYELNNDNQLLLFINLPLDYCHPICKSYIVATECHRHVALFYISVVIITLWSMEEDPLNMWFYNISPTGASVLMQKAAMISVISRNEPNGTMSVRVVNRDATNSHRVKIHWYMNCVQHGNVIHMLKMQFISVDAR